MGVEVVVTGDPAQTESVVRVIPGVLMSPAVEVSDLEITSVVRGVPPPALLAGKVVPDKSPLSEQPVRVA